MPLEEFSNNIHIYGNLVNRKNNDGTEWNFVGYE